MPRERWLAGLVPLLAACAESQGDTGTCGDVPTVEIGTGIAAFEDLDELAPLELVFGPQGGYHAPLAVRACGLEAGDQELHIVGVDEGSGAVVIDVRWSRLARGEGPCCTFVADVIGYVTLPESQATSDVAAALDGHVLALTATVVDAVGGEATGTLRIVAEAPAEE